MGSVGYVWKGKLLSYSKICIESLSREGFIMIRTLVLIERPPSCPNYFETRVDVYFKPWTGERVRCCCWGEI